MNSKKGEVTKTILRGLFWAGAFTIACSSPSFVPRVMPQIIKYASYRLRKSKKRNEKFYNAFYYLKNKGLVDIDNKGGQIYISLTPKGKRLAGKYQIDDLQISKPKKWDGKWRILIFDIEDKHKIKREALRGKLKELGLFQLQKSVWIFPYEFKKEIDLLREFFGFKKGEINLITASVIEDDEAAKNHFNFI